MRFADWRISAKLGAGLLAMTLLCLVPGSMAWLHMERMREASVQLSHVALPLRYHMQVLHTEHTRVGRYLSLVIDTQYHFTGENLGTQVKGRLDIIAMTEGEVLELLAGDGDTPLRAAWAQYDAEKRQWLRTESRLLASLAALDQATRTQGLLRASPHDPALRTLLQEMRELNATLVAAVNQMLHLQNTRVAQVEREMQAHYRQAQLWMLGMLAAVGLAAILLARLQHAVVQPIRQAVQLAHGMAAGHLQKPLPAPRGRDEAGQLLLALEAMRTALLELAGSMRGNADSVAQAAQEIAHNSQDLAQRTETQAGALEESTKLMQQLDAAARQNAEHARQASELASDTASTTERAEHVAQQMVQTMQKIHDDSQRIGEIISVVDSIALQTKILALNAAVEAARAGEHGKGFAVVAEEVQTLAQNSTTAAREIKRLITDSNQHVATGAQRIEQAGVTFPAIVAAVQRMCALLEQISSASARQSSSIAQVGEAIAHMERATQKNVAMAEESNSAAHTLQQRAQAMLASVVAFEHSGAPPQDDRDGNIVPDMLEHASGDSAARDPQAPRSAAPGEEDGRWGSF